MVRIAAHAHPAPGADGGLLVLDSRNGRWYALNATGACFWESWARGRGLDESVDDLMARHPGAARGRVDADGRGLLAELTRRGLVEPDPAAAGGTGGAGATALPPVTPSTDDAKTPGAPGPLRRALLGLAAVAALCTAFLLIHLPFRFTHRVVLATRTRWCRRPAGPATAHTLVTAVHRCARGFPGRAACLETSLAAVLLAAATRRRLDWCLGALTDPYRLHAWVACPGSARPVEPGPEPDGPLPGVTVWRI